MTAPPVWAGAERLLADAARRLERPVAPPWQAAVRRVSREAFLPARLWLRDGAGGYRVCDRGREPRRWSAAAASDIPLVTQLTDDGIPTSSASAPSTVLRMLEQARLRDDSRVLEIGTGTGYHAALLAARLSAGSVTTVELDGGLAERARVALERSGFGGVRVVTGDGALGFPPTAPYDAIIATCAIREVPDAWLEQMVPGAVIVAPWASSWLAYGTLTLTRQAAAGAQGRFAAGGSYMAMRGRHGPPVSELGDVHRPGHVPERSTTELSPWAVAGTGLDAAFAIGLAVPDVWHSWDTSGQHAVTRLWLADDAATSWAAVDHNGGHADAFAVAQWGPRRLWEEVAAAHRRWQEAGSPDINRHTLTAVPSRPATTVVTGL